MISKKLKTLRCSIYLFLILVFPFSAFGSCLGDQAAGKSRSVYIVPQLTVSKTYSNWAPFLEKLGLQSKQCFELIIPATIPLFEKELLSGKPDFAFVNPYHAVMAYRAKKYIPLVADGKNKLGGIIVVRADSNLNNLNALNGSKIAFPSPNSFGASLLVRSTLTKAGIAFEPIYVTSHQNVYRSVIAGDVIAGGGINNTFERESPEIKAQLKVMYTTPLFMAHPFVANPRVPLSEQKIIKETFISIKTDPSLMGLLDNLGIPDPIAVDYKNDYLPLEKLQLDKFVSSNGG
jgi:phosphonate transport system substrate-binding protein